MLFHLAQQQNNNQGTARMALSSVSSAAFYVFHRMVQSKPQLYAGLGREQGQEALKSLCPAI